MYMQTATAAPMIYTALDTEAEVHGYFTCVQQRNNTPKVKCQKSKII